MDACIQAYQQSEQSKQTNYKAFFKSQPGKINRWNYDYDVDKIHNSKVVLEKCELN